MFRSPPSAGWRWRLRQRHGARSTPHHTIDDDFEAWEKVNATLSAMSSQSSQTPQPPQALANDGGAAAALAHNSVVLHCNSELAPPTSEAPSCVPSTMTTSPEDKSASTTAVSAAAATTTSTCTSITAAIYGYDDGNLLQALNIIAQLQPGDHLGTGKLGLNEQLQPNQVFISRSNVYRRLVGENRSDNIKVIVEIFQRTINLLNQVIQDRYACSKETWKYSYAARAASSSHSSHSSNRTATVTQGLASSSSSSPPPEMLRCMQMDQFITRLREAIQKARANLDHLLTTYSDCPTTTEQLRVIGRCIDDAMLQVTYKLQQQPPPSTHNYVPQHHHTVVTATPTTATTATTATASATTSSSSSHAHAVPAHSAT